MANEWVLPFAVLAAASGEVRERATDSLVLASLPGAPAMRSAIAAVAVTQQAEEGLRRERQVAEQVLGAVSDAVADPGKVSVDSLRASPALRAVADEALVERIRGVAGPLQAQVLEQAVSVAETLRGDEGRRLSPEEAEKFPQLMTVLSEDQRSRLVHD